MAKRTSTTQFEIMLEYFQKYPQMLSGKVDLNFSKEMKEEKWEDLASELNTVGDGPEKSQAAWRKTLKDWKCYVKHKAGRIALHQKESGRGVPPKDKLTYTEMKLLAAIGELDLSLLELQDSGLPNYCENRKAGKVKIRNSLTAKDPAKLSSAQSESNMSQKLIAEAAQKKISLLEKKVLLLERKTIVAEENAVAKEHLVYLKERKVRQQWRKQSHELRMKKLQYL